MNANVSDFGTSFIFSPPPICSGCMETEFGFTALNDGRLLSSVITVAPFKSQTDFSILVNVLDSEMPLDRRVTHSVVRRKVHTLVCGEISSRRFDTANRELGLIVAATQAATNTYLTSVGITLDFIGWADTVTFDPEIQKAVNRAYIAEKLGPQLNTLERLATMDTKLKWNGGLPQYLGSNTAIPFIQVQPSK